MSKPQADKPFDPAQFQRQLAFDDLARSVLITIAAIAIVIALVMPSFGLVSSIIAPGLAVGLWVWWSYSTAQAGKALADAGKLLGAKPKQAEALIQQALRYRPVMRWARLLTYHRLAGLRHEQRRFDESAAICLCLLNQPLKGPAQNIRPHLLLMLAEAKLEQGDLYGAYPALAHLQQIRLGLTESLQRLAIQTRYEVAAQAYPSVLHNSRAKVELAELMPAAHCATMHAMLATAAQHTGQTRLADWLWERTRLIAPTKLLEQFERGGFSVGVGVVEHDQPKP